MRGTCSPGFMIRASLPGRAGPAGSRSPRQRADDGAGLAHPLVASLARDRDRCVRPRPLVRAGRGAPEARPAAARRHAPLAPDGRAVAAAGGGQLGAARTSPTSWRARTASTPRPWRRRSAFNNLKIAASEQAPRVCQGAMGVCGIVGFKNDTPYSVGRHLRDTHVRGVDDRERAHPSDERHTPARRQGRVSLERACCGHRGADGIPRRADRARPAGPERGAGRLRARHGVRVAAARARRR